MKELLDYIDVYRAEVSPSLCDQIVSTLEPSSQWVDAKVGQGDVRSDYRNCQVTSLRCHPELDAEVCNVVGRAINYYRANHPFADVSRDTGYNVLRYGVGSFFKEHADSYEGNLRVVSCSIALNDGYDGVALPSSGARKFTICVRGISLCFHPTLYTLTRFYL